MTPKEQYDAAALEIVRQRVIMKKLLNDELERRSGAKIGDVVVCLDASIRLNGTRGVITSWYDAVWPYTNSAWPWVHVHLFNKDGTLGARTMIFFDWEKV